MDRASKRAAELGVSADCVWGVGDPAQVIVDTAKERGASKIMVGAHHHGFLGRLFGGTWMPRYSARPTARWFSFSSSTGTHTPCTSPTG